MSVSLVLPCYNPQAGWEHVVCDGYQAFSKAIGQPAELIIVLDGTSAAVTEAALAGIHSLVPGLVVISYPDNRGKGYAIRQGVAKATGITLD